MICVPDIAVHERRMKPSNLKTTTNTNTNTNTSKHAHIRSGNELSKKQKTIEISQDTSDFLLLACDGVAEVLDNNVDVISYVRDCIAVEISTGKKTISYANISRQLIEYAHGLYSTDNISVIVAPLILS